MAGVLVAGLATQYLIPWILGDRPLVFRRIDVPALDLLARSRWPAAIAAIAVAAAAAWLAYQLPAWWQRDLAGISPVPPQMRLQDAELRREMGAPEVSVFVASRGSSREDALRAADSVLPVLQRWKREQRIRSFDSPVWYLPAPETQIERLRLLPEPAALELNLARALKGLAFRPDAFKPFVDEVGAARREAELAVPPVSLSSYAGTPLGTRLNALVVELDGQWLVLTPLGGVTDPERLAQDLAVARQGTSQLVDLKRVSADMVDGFRREALTQAGWGAVLILILLVAGLRSVKRALRVALPAAAALILTVAALVASGELLSVFHLVALLLVLGIGLNYALFFERVAVDAVELSRIRLALAVCSTSTVVTFGLLALSATPVLHAIGRTVALGAILAMTISALWARRNRIVPAGAVR